MPHLWEWALTYKRPHLLSVSGSSLALPDVSEQDTMVEVSSAVTAIGQRIALATNTNHQPHKDNRM